MPATVETHMFDDELPAGMSPLEDSGIDPVTDDLPMGPSVGAPEAPAAGEVRERAGRDDVIKVRLENQRKSEAVPWNEVRKLSDDQLNEALISRGMLTAEELAVLDKIPDVLKVLNVKEMKIMALAPSRENGKALENLYLMGSLQRSNAIAVPFTLAEGLPKVIWPVTVKPFFKKDGTLGIDYRTVEEKKLELYVVNNVGDPLFEPLNIRSNMTDNEKAAIRDTREFAVEYFKQNGTLPEPKEVRLWNKDSKVFEKKKCIIGRKGADYLVATVPVEDVEAALDNNPERSVWLGGKKYKVDLSKEAPEVTYNIVNEGGAWVTGTPAAGGEKKKIFVHYDAANVNLRSGSCPDAIRQSMRDAFARRQEAKQARAQGKEVKNEQSKDTTPRRSLR